MEKNLWEKVDAVSEGIPTEWQLILLAAVLAAGYVLRWLVERHTLEYQHRQKINETLAEKLHQYSVENYAPLVNLVDRLIEFLKILAEDENPSSDAENPQAARFIQPLRQILAILAKNRQSSVIFLRSLRGEEVVYFIFRKRFIDTVLSDECLTRKVCTKILDEGVELTSDSHFLQRPQSEATGDAIEKFFRWSQEKPAVRKMQLQLRCFRETMLFEINVSHRGWYRRNQLAELTWKELLELNSLLKDLEQQRIEEGRRWKLLAPLARRRYLVRICGLRRGLRTEKSLRKKAREAERKAPTI